MRNDNTEKFPRETTKILKRGLKWVTVEPVMFLTVISMTILMISYDTVLYNAVCVQKYSETICSNLKNGSEEQTTVQDSSVQWKMYGQVGYFVPAIFADTIMGAWGDKHGRQINMLWGLGGGILFTFLPVIIVASFPNLPLLIFVGTGILAGCTGCLVIIIMSANAYLADTVKDKSFLAIRMTVLQGVMGFGAIIGQIAAGVLMSHVALSFSAMIGQIMMVLAFFYVLIFIRQVPPSQVKISESPVQDPDASLSVNSSSTIIDQIDNYPIRVRSDSQISIISKTDSESAKNFLSTLWAQTKLLLKDCWITFSKPRYGHSRGLLIAICVTDVFYSFICMGIRSVFTFFTFGAPLNWSPSTLSYWRTIDSICSTVGSLVGIFVLKKLLKFSEPAVIILSILSTAGGFAMISLSSSMKMMYISSAISFIGGCAGPCYQSLAAQLVDKDEVGKAFTVFSITQELSLLFSVGIFSKLFPILQAVHSGFIFLISSFAMLCCCVVFVFIYFVRLWDTRASAMREF